MGKIPETQAIKERCGTYVILTQHPEFYDALDDTVRDWGQALAQKAAK